MSTSSSNVPLNKRKKYLQRIRIFPSLVKRWSNAFLLKKSASKSFLGDLSRYLILRRQRKVLLNKTIHNYHKETDFNLSAYKQKLDEIDFLDEVAGLNFSYLYRWLPILIFAIVFGILMYFSQRVSSTNVRIDLLVTGVDLRLDTTDKIDRNLSLNIGTSEKQFSMPASKVEGVDNYQKMDSTKSYRILSSSKTRDTAILRTIQFNKFTEIFVNQPDSTSLQMILMADSLYNQNVKVSWDLDVPSSSLIQDTTLTLGADKLKGSLTKLLFSRLLGSEAITINIPNPHKWEASSRIYVRELFFRKPNFSAEKKSSVISGRIKLQDTNLDTISLYNRDLLKVQFVEPVEVFLSGNKQGIKIHVDGLATKLESGPQYMDKDKRDRMPRNFNTVTDATPYVVSIVLVLITLLPALLRTSKRK